MSWYVFMYQIQFSKASGTSTSLDINPVCLYTWQGRLSLKFNQSYPESHHKIFGWQIFFVNKLTIVFCSTSSNVIVLCIGLMEMKY